MISYSVCVSLTYFTKRNTLQLHPYCCKWQNFVRFMAQQYSNACEYIHTHTTSSLSIPLLMDTWVASISWLLYIVLQWMLWCKYLSKLVFPFCLGISLGALTLFEKLVEYSEVDGLAQKLLVSDPKSWWPVFRNAASSSMLTYGSFLFCSTKHCGQRHSTGWVA